MSKDQEQLQYLQTKEEVAALRQRLVSIDQRLTVIVAAIRRYLCDTTLEFTLDRESRLQKWQESGVVEAGELVRQAQEIKPQIAQKEQYLRDYEDATRLLP